MATLGRKDAYPLENYKRGTRVWLRDNEHVWLRADLLDDLKATTQTFKLKREIDDEIVEEKFDLDALPFLANPEILIGKDDLTNMSYLHEPAVLHNLRFRFEKKKAIYTYCGIVLVAINPYADCSAIYSDDVISIYGNAGNQSRADLDPHIYAIAAEAFYDMREYEKNQSIIVSGESGAGKTVSAKFVMKYLANVAGSKKPRRTSDNSPGIESRVLASNPIMESIGNAKTIRNDNSSRFGKFIQINFSEDYTIAGAEMKTYLLEKSRVVFQSKNERNYHVFYQMCAAANHPLLSKLGLLSSDDYAYTNQGQDPFIPGVDDSKDFSELTKAFDMLKIDQKRQAEIFQIFAGVLLLGNLQFEPIGNGEQSTISRNSSSIIDKLCDQSIFNVESTPLKTWLSAREIRAGSEVVRKHLNVNDASANRDALAKMIYACMFNWIVDKVNESLDHQHNASKSSRRVKSSKFIGVLDIYGFETFDINSFEQFCINYANEKLQQQFNQHVFKLEQQEYEREEISWVRIDFYDNQPCIDLIEAQPGIISYLDEQCKMGRGSDEDWLNLMKNCPKLKKSSHLVMPKFKDPSFLVKHFAADVSYKIDGFLEKNKDTVNEQLLGVFAKTQFPFLKEVIHHILDTSSTGAKRKKTVAIQFKESLSDLINVLSVTRPHYVRCIKPNDEKEYFYFEPKRAIQQLRACGVLETVRISAAGYPSRWAYDEFGRRYRVLYPEGKALWKHKPKEFAKLACEKWLEPEKFALGKTKMFFRVGQVARLEKNRQDVLTDSAIKIQTAYRGFVARRRYLQMMSSIRTIQAATRAFLAYRRIKYLQMHRAAICIQSAWRGYHEKQKYNKIRNAIISIQAAYRGREVRRRVLAIRFEKSAVTIQRYFRGFLVRREQIKRIRKIIKCQSAVRRFLAKRQLKKLKAERTTVLFWENKHQSLEKKIIDMQQKLDAMASERNQYAVRCSTLDEVKAQCDRLQIEREELLAIKNVKEMQDIQLKDLNEKLKTQTFEIENITKKFNEELSAIRDVKEMQDIQLIQLNDQLTSQATEMDDITQKFTDLTILNESYKSQIESLTSNQLKELEQLRENYTKLEESYRKIDSQLYVEKEKVKRIESERNEMRQQLASNADLLVSEFTRGSDLRNSMRSISSDGTNVDSSNTDSQTVIKQYEHTRELNAKLQAMQREKEKLMNKCMQLQNEINANHYSTKETYDSLKSQELEMENAKLKRDIADLCTNRGKSGMDEYITQLQETLENRQQENIELRALLANVYEKGSRHSPKPDADDYGYHSTENSDDGTNSTTDTYIDDILEKERLLRNTLKENQILANESAAKDEIIANLEEQIQNLTSNQNPKMEQPEFETDIGLNVDLDDGFHSTTSSGVVQTPKQGDFYQLTFPLSDDEDYLDDGIQDIHHDGASETSSTNTSVIQTKVLCENMLLQQKVNRQSDELYELRSQLRGYSTSSDSAASDQNHGGDGDFIRLQPLQTNNTHSGYLHVFNVPEFARVLIYELKPRIAKQLTHCLPAYLLLSGFRYYDREKDETAITGLFAAAQSVLKEIAVNSNDADILSLWLINTWRLFNLLRQYSSEENEEWNAQNTEKQNSHKITNFNVEPLRNQLKIRIEVFYQSFMKKTVEPLLSPKIVPGVLQHDSSQLLANSNGSQSHSGLTRQLSKDVVVQRALDDLIALLNVVYNKLQAFGADSILIKQTFWQITKWICAQALNNLMFRKDLCKFEKAIQIKHNVSELQNWLYQKGLGDIRAVLEPLVQACHLLQSRKDEGNLETLCGEMTSELNAKQVVSILQHYTPSDGFEEDAIDMEFLIKVQTRLVARAAAAANGDENEDKEKLILPGTFLQPFNCEPFVYSDVNLETLTLPPSLHLNNVARFA